MKKITLTLILSLIMGSAQAMLQECAPPSEEMVALKTPATNKKPQERSCWDTMKTWTLHILSSYGMARDPQFFMLPLQQQLEVKK